MADKLEHPFDLIEVEKRCLVETDNMMHAWAAYSLARANKAPVPEWVFRYFDRAARNLFELSADASKTGGKDLGPKIATALHLSSKGAGSPLVTYHSDWLVFGMNVRARLPAFGGKEYLAIENVADQAGVSVSTVGRAFKLYNALFPGPGIFPDEALGE
jgi:hypothetical protein